MSGNHTLKADDTEATPETDAALLDAKLKHRFPNASFVHADFARILERRLRRAFHYWNQEKERNRLLHEQIKRLCSTSNGASTE